MALATLLTQKRKKRKRGLEAGSGTSQTKDYILGKKINLAVVC